MLSDYKMIEEENLSNYTGVARLVFEHSYMKNYRELIERSQNENEINITPLQCVKFIISLKEKKTAESFYRKLWKSELLTIKEMCHKCESPGKNSKYFAEISEEERKICALMYQKLLEFKEPEETSRKKTLHSNVFEKALPNISLSSLFCKLVHEKNSPSEKMPERVDIGIKPKILLNPNVSPEEREMCEEILKSSTATESNTVKFLVHVEISPEEKEICETMVKKLSELAQVDITEESNDESNFLLNVELSPKEKELSKSLHKKVLEAKQFTPGKTCNNCSNVMDLNNSPLKMFNETETLVSINDKLLDPVTENSCVTRVEPKENPKLSKLIKENSSSFNQALSQELCEAKKICDLESPSEIDKLSGADKSFESKNSSGGENLTKSEQSSDAGKSSQIEKIIESENSSEAVKIFEVEKISAGEMLFKGENLSEIEKTLEDENLSESSKHIKNCNIQLPIRRSHRHIHKIQKDKLVTSVNCDSVHPVMSNMNTETNQRNDLTNNKTLRNLNKKINYKLSEISSEAEKSSECEKIFESESSTEAEKSSECEKIFETENSTEAEKSYECKKIFESENSTEVKKLSECERTFESENSIEAEKSFEYKNFTEAKKSFEFENTPESKKSSEVEKEFTIKKSSETFENEKSSESPKHVQNQLPVRRSLRYSKIQKDAVTASGTSNSVHSVISNTLTETNEGNNQTNNNANTLNSQILESKNTNEKILECELKSLAIKSIKSLKVLLDKSETSIAADKANSKQKNDSNLINLDLNDSSNSEIVLETEKLFESKKSVEVEKTSETKENFDAEMSSEFEKSFESENSLEAEKSSEVEETFKAKKSSEDEKSFEDEKLCESPKCIENYNIQLPVRRSLRHINKIQKDALATSTTSNSIQSMTSSSNTETNKGKYRKNNKANKLNSKIIENISTDGKINECKLKSPAKKSFKSLKVLIDNETFINAEKANIKQKNYLTDIATTKKDEFINMVRKEGTERLSDLTMFDGITADTSESKRKNNSTVTVAKEDRKSDSTVTESRRKRTFSEPCKSAFLPDIESLELKKPKNKKIKRSLKFKDFDSTRPSEKLIGPNSVLKRKRNLSVPSGEVLKEDMSKSIDKTLEISNKKRKNCLSSPENSSLNQFSKAVIKKSFSSEGKNVEAIDVCSPPSNVTKPKCKKIQKVTLNYDNEPALFSQPDILITVGAKKTIEDKTMQLQQEDSNKIIEETDSASKVTIFDTKVDQSHAKCTDNKLQVMDNDSKANFSNTNNQEIVSPAAVIPNMTLLNDSQNKTNKLECESSFEKENINNFESEKDSLQVDESICEKTAKKLSEIPNIPTEKPNANVNNELSLDNSGKKDLDSTNPKAPNCNIEDLDCDKPIAERKPRRIIKKKEFFEDISSRSPTQVKRSSGRQKNTTNKKNEESKQGRSKASSKAAEESEESDYDDPTKLWCICRQPHNERFMIMCDRCEDWFHGNCVGISKTQGRMLEKLKKEWICPNCRKKDLEADAAKNDTAMSQTQKDSSDESEQKKVTAKKTATESKELKPPKKDKTTDNTRKADLKKASAKPISPKNSTPDTPTSNNKKGVNSSSVSKKNINKKNLNTSKGTECSSNSKKDSEVDSQRNVAVDQVKANEIVGDSTPSNLNVVSWLKANQSYMVASSPTNTSSKNASQKKEVDSTSSSKDKIETSDEVKEMNRINVRKTLISSLMDRIKNADDINMSEDDVKGIVDKIEEEMYLLFKTDPDKYRKKYRKLVFNIKDLENQGLFRKIVKGNILPDKLVLMSSKDLASEKLSKWREKENQHTLDMIKRVQLEQQSGSGLLLKKTHKGEVEIEEDFKVIEDIPKVSIKPLSEESTEPVKPVPEKEIVKDTTSQHRSHLFDANCKICTGKVIPAPIDTIPKEVHISRSISIDRSHSTNLDPNEKSASRAGDKKPGTGDQGVPIKSSIKQKASSYKKACAIWQGSIEMFEVGKMNVSAFNVSGDTDFFTTDVAKSLVVKGRAKPHEVWNYIGKIKQKGSKDLSIVRFNPYTPGDEEMYEIFFQTLSSKKRYGVFHQQHFSKKIKEIYLLPLPSTSPVPVVLMPFDGPGLPDRRHNALLGVVIRHKAGFCFEEINQIDPPVFENEKSNEEDKLGSSHASSVDTRSYTPPLPPIKTEPKSPSNSSSPPLSIVSEYGMYSPSMPPYNGIPNSPTQYEPGHCATNEKDSEMYESFYTPLHLIELPKAEEDKPYDPEEDILCNKSEDLQSSHKDGDQSVASNNLETHKKLLDVLTQQYEETKREINELKLQFISCPDESDAGCISPDKKTLNSNNSSARTSSSVELPENLQDLLNVVREKSSCKEKFASKADVDMRINKIFKEPFNSLNNLNVSESVKITKHDDRNISSNVPPPLTVNEENSSKLGCQSSPQMKIRTNFHEPFFEETANISSISELVKKVDKELNSRHTTEKTQNISPTLEKLTTTEIDALPPTCWSEYKEPPPPGIEMPELNSSDSAFPSEITSCTSKSDISNSAFSSSLVRETQQISPHFPLPSIPPAFPPPPLLPRFPIQTPPPNLKNIPPPNVISAAFPPPLPPPLPVVSNSSDIIPVSEPWSSWTISSQQSNDDTWQNRVPQWDENWKSSTENKLVDYAESSSHYYPAGSSEFRKESFYRKDSSSEKRWNMPPKFGRNNWQKRPPRGGHSRGGRGSFYFNKSSRNG